MIEFILNNRLIQTDKASSTTLLDFIRYDENLRGTKIGCREGDCGACTVLIGSLKDGEMEYMSVTSCLTPLPNAHGKHVVSIEGTNIKGKLSQAQQAMVDCSGTQCGFCTPGFINAMCGFALSDATPTIENAISAIDGNICRCTGYKSIERATANFNEKLKSKDLENPMPWLVDNNFIPEYFLQVADRLKEIKTTYNTNGQIPISGGTDLYVQKHDEIHDMDLNYLFDRSESKEITFQGNLCTLKSAVTVSDLIQYERLLQDIPNWYTYLKLVSSTPIRNIATVAGNLANGSPIGDLTIILLAMNAIVTVTNKANDSRPVPLKDFYLGYKTLNKNADEIISEITFEVSSTNKFNFEKVCKRQYLDIASVNTACTIAVNGTTISNAIFSMGGVGPIPKYLEKTSDFLVNQSMTIEVIKEAEKILQKEISPISDARGTADYKRLLARQLFFAHFIKLFPETFKMDDLVW